MRYEKGWNTAFSILCLSAFLAYLESIVYRVLHRSWLKRIWLILMVALHSAFIIIEYYLLLNFQTIITIETVNILLDTNPEESANFIETYLKIPTVCLYLLFAGVIVVAAWLLSKLIEESKLKVCFLVFSIIGLFILIYCGYSFAVYRNGMSIPQYTSVTRTLHSLYAVSKNQETTRKVCEYNRQIQVSQDISHKPTIVVVIGESMSVYHSSLYGYEKQTNPLLSKRKDKGELLIFDNAVSLHDHTTSSLEAMLSLDSLRVDYTNKALFPICFKKAGYHTEMFDNQYFVGSGYSSLTDRELSEMMYDKRNSHRWKYDGDMVGQISVEDSASLYMIHLWGQHYTYKERFPPSFSIFTADDYDGNLPESKREIMADYDNAMLYNDFVVDRILQKFESQYCCVFYLSDHGEEVYEVRDYMGHGNAGPSPNPNYQIRIPLMVWFSPSFLEDNPQLFEQMAKAIHYPICSDDIGHTLLDVAGIKTADFVDHLSILNPHFDTKRHRIVLHSVDYDSLWFEKR